MIARQISSDNHDQPLGSAYVDDMLQRYLPTIGIRQFHLESDENQHYAFKALFDTISKYGPDGFAAKKLWDGVLRGAPYNHVLLLPDTESGRQYHLKFGDNCLILNGRESVPLSLRRAFVNLVLQDKRRDKRYVKSARTDLPPTRSQRRPAITVGDWGPVGESGNRWLDAMLDADAEVRRQDRNAQVKTVIEITYARMNNELHVRVVKALRIDCSSAKEVAKQFDMTPDNVRKISYKFMRLFKQAWKDESKEE